MFRIPGRQMNVTCRRDGTVGKLGGRPRSTGLLFFWRTDPPHTHTTLPHNHMTFPLQSIPIKHSSRVKGRRDHRRWRNSYKVDSSFQILQTDRANHENSRPSRRNDIEHLPRSRSFFHGAEKKRHETRRHRYPMRWIFTWIFTWIFKATFSTVQKKNRVSRWILCFRPLYTQILYTT